MDQNSYELILKCIKLGAPILAEQLINALNATVQIANEHIMEKETKK